MGGAFKGKVNPTATAPKAGAAPKAATPEPAAATPKAPAAEPAPATVPGPNNALRDTTTGRFAPNPNKVSKPSSPSTHGNSRSSTAETHLYRLETIDGTFLKWGITQDLNKRYPSTYMHDKLLKPMTRGTRDQMIELERWIVERDPGPLNKEPWAGSKQ